MSECKNCESGCPSFIFSHRVLKKKCRFCGCKKPEQKITGIEEIISELIRKQEIVYTALKPPSTFRKGYRIGYYNALSHLRIEFKKAEKGL